MAAAAVIPPVAGAAAAGAIVAGAAGAAAAEAATDLRFDLDACFATPPWPEQAPRPDFSDVVPSLHCVAPPLEAAAGAAAGAAAAAAAGLAASSFFTPPWPEQAPRPLAVDVVPSTQVTGAAVFLANAGMDTLANNSGAASNPIRKLVFMNDPPDLIDARILAAPIRGPD